MAGTMLTERDHALLSEIRTSESSIDLGHFSHHDKFVINVPSFSDKKIEYMHRGQPAFCVTTDKSTVIGDNLWFDYLKAASKHCVVLWHPMLWEEAYDFGEPSNLHRLLFKNIKLAINEETNQFTEKAIYLVRNCEKEKTPLVMFTRAPTSEMTVEHLKAEIKAIHDMCPSITSFHIITGEDIAKTKMGDSMGPIEFLRYMREDVIDFNGKIDDDIYFNIQCITKKPLAPYVYKNERSLEMKLLTTVFPYFNDLKFMLYNKICGNLF